ncbi:hypothetical protein P8C59_007404 [Phyllachora maydis]|uniref:Uncharacterized protein n=1 Tax=Phyllachora maydis TaxID=1825666 RepID=A0AAD9ME68_9PEZI|nr:hypothetical protein P8C59_007404 [Phyllachora maydis]
MVPENVTDPILDPSQGSFDGLSGFVQLLIQPITCLLHEILHASDECSEGRRVDIVEYVVVTGKTLIGQDVTRGVRSGPSTTLLRHIQAQSINNLPRGVNAFIRRRYIR